MCGICGIVAYDREGADLQSVVDAALSRLTHRGPDERGSRSFLHCVLGHARLSIVDLESGQQPMLDGSGRICVTFNGEVYGYEALRESLGKYSFTNSSDTEVLLALYRRYGTEMLRHLPGMFAFAIWDEERQALFCGRDRFGEKPLYYAIGPGGEFVFASEIKAIIASGIIEPRLKRSAVAHYLTRLYVNPHETIYENVHTLPPAHALEYRDGRIHTWRYWDFPNESHSIELGDAVERFRELMHQAVRRQLVADVPVGAFLSGGLDSSTIVAAAVKTAPLIQTFSFDFEGVNSEAQFARAVAESIGSRHVELRTVDTDLADVLVRMQDVYDEPFGDSSNIPTYLLAKAARRHVKVALCGDGGDELLGGYAWYRPLAAMGRSTKASAFSYAVARVAARATRLFASQTTATHWENLSLAQQYRIRYPSLLAAHYETTRWFTPRQLQELGLADAIMPLQCGLADASDHHSVGDAMRWDISNYMSGDILTKIDRASMAHGLELRAPFLDVDLATFCISLPDRLKITDEEDKIILRRAFSDEWPVCVRGRRKQGFGAPVAEWLARPGFRELVDEYLLNPRRKIHDLLSRERVMALARRGDYKSWILLVLSLWLERPLYKPL